LDAFTVKKAFPHKGKIALLFVLVAPLLSFCSGAKDGEVSRKSSSRNDIGFVLEELIPGMEWNTWFRQTSGYSPDPEHFGGYITLPVGADLYIGMGTGIPTLGDGALVARFDGGKIEAIGALAEEGIHEMIWDHRSGTLHIAGTDPSWPDDWSAGNHYTYFRSGTRAVVKHRDPRKGLVNVIHTWGLWFSNTHVLYAAVNSHDGSFTRDRNILRRIFDRINSTVDRRYYSTDYGVTRMGQIFKSEDSGKTWGHVSDVGYFRAYDVVGFNDKFYVLYADTPESPCKLAVSEDGAEKWRDVTQDYIQRVHLIQFQDKLLAVSHNGKSIYAINNDIISKHELPKGYRIETHFNVLAVGNDFLYAVCTGEDGNYSILRTPDLRDWEKVVGTDKKLVSLCYWETQHSLVVSDTGLQAKLWKIDLNQPLELGRLPGEGEY
jgi:hypothetical protein